MIDKNTCQHKWDGRGITEDHYSAQLNRMPQVPTCSKCGRSMAFDDYMKGHLNANHNPNR